EVGAAVAEETPFGTVFRDLVQVETMHQHAFLRLADAPDQLAEMIGDKGMAIVALGGAIVLLDADAVRGHHRHCIGHGVSLPYALPLAMRVERRIRRLRAEGRRVEQT